MIGGPLRNDRDKRRRGWFGAVIGRYAVETNGLTDVALTKLDVLSAFDYSQVKDTLMSLPRERHVLIPDFCRTMRPFTLRELGKRPHL